MNNIEFKTYITVQEFLTQIYNGSITYLRLYITTDEYYKYKQKYRKTFVSYLNTSPRDGCYCQIKYHISKENIDTDIYQPSTYKGIQIIIDLLGLL